jgi:peptidyl-prolyl cis-trans isomerase C
MSLRHLFFSLPLVVLASSCDKPAQNATANPASSTAAASLILPGALEGSGDLVATVNEKQLKRNLLDAAIRTFPPLMRTQLDRPENLTQLVDSLVTTELLYQEALTQGIDRKPDMKAQLALAQRKALADAMMYQVLEQRITDDRIKAWYDDHKVQFARSQVHLGLIVTATRAEADAVKGALDKGADFAQVAAAKSGHPSNAAGGDVGWVPVDQLDTQIKGLGKEKVGAIVGPMDIGGAWHLFKVLDRKDSGRGVEEVRDEIQMALQKEVMEEYIKELRTKSTVMVSANLDATAKAPSVPAVPGAPSVPPAVAPAAPPAPTK